MNPLSAPAGLTRRRALHLAGLAGISAGLAACGKGFGGKEAETAGKVTLNMVWWGDATRAAVTRKALDLFEQKNPGIVVKTEYQDSGPYKDKLATRFASGDVPDLLAMRVDSVREYADRNALIDLGQHADALDLSKLNPNVLALAQVGTANYGVASGLNSIGFVVDKAAAAKYGVAVPDGDTWSWADLAAFAKEITAKSKRAVYGTGFDPHTLSHIGAFTRQRGEDFYTTDGGIGMSKETLIAWFDMIGKMRAEGGYPPAGFLEKTTGGAAQSYIAKGKIASQIIPTNQFLAHNAVCKGNLALLRMPGETTGKRRGQSIDTPYLWSIADKSKHQAEALKLLNFLLNDPESSKLTGTTRGVPANPEVAAAIAPSLPPDDQVATAYIAGLQKETLLPSYPNPKGASTLFDSLESVGIEVSFGRKTPAAGATEFLAAAHKALGK